MPVKVALLLVLATATAIAQPRVGPPRVVAVMPLSTLGAEDKSAGTKKLLVQIENAIASLPGTKVVPSAQVTAAIERAKKPQLKQCEGDSACAAEVGRLVGAQFVVTGEIGGLGESRVIYLKTTDVTAGREVRSTTLAIDAKGTLESPLGAAVRLLEPEKYRGNVRFAFDVANATVLVNGTKVALTGKKELALPVGTHAVTVTHPQYHNFVKFVEVTYGKTTDVQVSMKQYPIVEHDVRAKPGERDTVEYVDPPLWRRWYVAGPAILVLGVGAAILTASLVSNFPDYDNCRKVGAMGC